VFAGIFSVSCSGGGSDFVEVPGWSQSGEVLTYDSDTLWEYINGAAELFVEYGVQSCRTTDLSHGDVTVTVELYDMGTPLSAFGVFRREYAGDAIAIEEATAATLSLPYQALLVKGNTYAKVNVFEGELTEDVGRELLLGLAQGLPGGTAVPTELDLLPSEGKVAGSEGYKPSAFMGLVELTDCVYAEYANEGGEPWQGFVVLPEAASAVWDGLSADWIPMELGTVPVLYREVPYLGLVGVARTDTGLFGVSGAANEAELRDRLGRFVP
jgi:hypothetical protein